MVILQRCARLAMDGGDDVERITNDLDHAHGDPERAAQLIGQFGTPSQLFGALSRLLVADHGQAFPAALPLVGYHILVASPISSNPAEFAVPSLNEPVDLVASVTAPQELQGIKFLRNARVTVRVEQ